MLIKDIGEQGLLRILQKFCPAEIVGDDCAVLPTNPHQSLAVTTDMLVDGVHFSDRTTSPYDAGWRAAAANLSDLAAMGAKPLAVTVALAVTADTAVLWVEEFYRGMTACLEVYHTPIAGGDVVRSSVVTISITAFGEVECDRTIRRSNARSENWAIVATGVHGASRAGLELLLNPEFGLNLEKGDRTSLILAHQRPKPRLDVLPMLWEILGCEGEIEPPLSPPLGKGGKQDLNSPPLSKVGVNSPPLTKGGPGGVNSPIAIAGMDSSDGLADAIIQVCRASGVGAKVDRTKIPIPPSLSEIVSAEKALDWALYGGEDFELVLFLPIANAELLVEKIGNGAAIIGMTTDSTDIWLTDSSGIYGDIRLESDRGFQHF
ncbi:MAG: thiamine-phosphate kinase [Microcoleus sp. PH2017_01_SCD_O_A]|uniref:thiamine-phosphate kinase n=1 Tax=unclassified Microcoleus TaxID=2642155 RepID=UPI001DB2BE9C|nr:MULTISPECIES: thiamine-phosphate kinase [unclassified Microcoleus]MCC3428171.1 thiamine-phosphate kinase [Microcoleus sp. PH2017_01_SCD_O_A]MCC3457765.1 thiamine-phosphate kinase [Microcoleus sp. PH2017_08_TRC_O_A]MCC3501048.1 thiamine-phosphate kinase [Microcoleus sp. PH2017_15_JOR_U_A]MCC3569608.1 thiamine-phosphate kinase [Microcoleus sp. PH2017_31_RDM_U_A]MCC3582314.1 thiamine-phosphate kinase [Microcoleus sp. PH2017_32_RDM_D_A]